MTDQAAELRNLIRADERQSRESSSAARMLVVSGGKAGVGSTTVATNLAVALALEGRQVALVDADLLQGGVCDLCGLTPGRDIAEMLLGGEAAQSLQTGPAGIQVLAGRRSTRSAELMSGRDEFRFADKLYQLGDGFDFVIVDSGNGNRSLTRSLWKSADDVWLVTTPDAVTLMDSYAVVKTMRDTRDPTHVSAVVNQASPLAAKDVYGRLEAACRRFLGQAIELAGNVPLDTMLAVAAQTHVPFVVQAPTAKATRAISNMIADMPKSAAETELGVASRAAGCG